MVDRPYTVASFTDRTLHEALSNDFCPPERLSSNRSIKYLLDYLTSINAKTVVIEADYIDRDYLDDFASFYVKCFNTYNRRCKRVHFFACAFTAEQFAVCIRGSDEGLTEARLQQHYLGFVVARPLPDAVIGRTILATYPEVVNDFETVAFCI